MNKKETRCIYADRCSGFNIRNHTCFEASKYCGFFRGYEMYDRKSSVWVV